MSILLREEIRQEYEAGRIVILPYEEHKLGPNSYDVSLSDELTVYVLGSKFSPRTTKLDSRGNNKTRSFKIPECGFELQPGVLYLGAKIEKIGSDHYIPMYEGRSSMARLGIQSHISAGFGDVGFKTQWTLEILVVHPVIIYPGQSIGQIYFNRINESFNHPKYRYNGKYVNQTGPTPSRSYLDLVHSKTQSTGVASQPNDFEELFSSVLSPDFEKRLGFPNATNFANLKPRRRSSDAADDFKPNPNLILEHKRKSSQ
jgi:dCTP deaminase